MSYGKYSNLEIDNYKQTIMQKVKYLIQEEIIYDSQYKIQLKEYDVVCKEESFNFGIDVYIESTLTIRYELKDENENIISTHTLYITDEDCYGVGYASNPFESIATIKIAILEGVDLIESDFKTTYIDFEE